MRSTTTGTGADVSPRRPAHEALTTPVTEFNPAPRNAAGLVVDLSVVIPAYNEQGRLGPTLDRVRQYLSGRRLTWELIVVDDGSVDRTAETVLWAAAADARIRLVRYPRNRGKGHAVR